MDIFDYLRQPEIYGYSILDIIMSTFTLIILFSVIGLDSIEIFIALSVLFFFMY